MGIDLYFLVEKKNKENNKWEAVPKDSSISREEFRKDQFYNLDPLKFGFWTSASVYLLSDHDYLQEDFEDIDPLWEEYHFPVGPGMTLASLLIWFDKEKEHFEEYEEGPIQLLVEFINKMKKEGEEIRFLKLTF